MYEPGVNPQASIHASRHEKASALIQYRGRLFVKKRQYYATGKILPAVVMDLGLIVPVGLAKLLFGMPQHNEA